MTAGGATASAAPDPAPPTGAVPGQGGSAPGRGTAADERALSGFQRFMYALGNGAQGIGPTLVLGWLQYFYTETASGPDGVVRASGPALLSYAVFGYIAGAARLPEALFNPVIGFASDRLHTRWGRRRPFLFFLAPVLALSLVALWFPPAAAAGAANGVWLGAFLGLFWLSYSGVVLPYLALLPEITPFVRERIKVSELMGYTEVAGLLIASVGAGAVIEAYRRGVRLGPLALSDGYKVMAIPLGLLTLACLWCAAWGVKETPHGTAKEVPFRFGAAVRQTFKNPLFAPYVASVSFFRICIDTVIMTLPYLVVKVLGKKEDLAGLLQGGVVVFAVLLFPLVARLSHRYGMRHSYLLGLLGFAVGLPLIFFAGSAPFLGVATVKLLGLCGATFADPHRAAQLAHVIVILAVVGFPVATALVLPRPLLAEIIDHDEQLTGFRREAMYNGMDGIIHRAAGATVPLVTTQLFAAFGASVDRPLGILLVGPVTGALALVALVSFLPYQRKDGGGT